MRTSNSIDTELWPVTERFWSLVFTLSILLTVSAGIYFEPQSIGKVIYGVGALIVSRVLLEDIADLTDAVRQKLFQKQVSRAY